MDLFILFTVLAFVVIFILTNLKLLYYYEHPDDRSIGQAVLCKIMVVVGLLLAWLLILLLPIDVYNSRPAFSSCLFGGSDCPRLDMKWFWSGMYICIAVFVTVFLPFATFYYEADTDQRVTKCKPWQSALFYMGFTIVIVAAIVGISFALLSKASIPVKSIECDRAVAADSSEAPSVCSKAKDAVLEVNVSFEIYLIGIMCFVGWFLFALFGGIGLTAIPLDLILSYIDRPTAMDLSKFSARKKLLGEKATNLRQIGEDLKGKELDLRSKTGWSSRKEKAALSQEYNKFKQAVYLLEREWAHLEISLKEKGENPVISIAKLVLGILCAILSVLWLLHILLYNIVSRLTGDLVPITAFFNDILIAMERTGFFMLSLAAYAILVVYLMACVVKGCFKFGMRIFFLFPIHPMKPHETHMNTFLFNVMLILISAGAIVQFSQDAFAEYARLTDADVIFSAQIRHLKFFKYFFANNVFIYILLAWSLVTMIYLLMRPRDTPAFDLNPRKMNEHQAINLEKQVEKNQKKAAARLMGKGGGGPKRGRPQV
ncbi:unnamed protein product [Vitrella brassicaformis CCMP3155]|uniref:LMBR1-like conserved region-containing protein n=1 Tax=Vitrella brassicaformis (strain CCMP3155) TaxID=1169540 RepID=A0A0G4EK02_VITBC|nr:unnamed protein product [Vitrella brassicaformis CCMP3155]|mmetsp:Transcript_19721/g.47799  ORF Transcript_19721/g.47799 Transcript_19721/m.47799 type:complete len:543 (-) Transcript_19721:437-2065(-)|eukprot:CEL97760.1 unnamed protein product [Vitrella brassicaformis CCMP3155]